MPPICNVNAVITCPHQAGIAKPIPKQMQVMVGGAPALRITDMPGTPILPGCPNLPTPGTPAFGAWTPRPAETRVEDPVDWDALSADPAGWALPPLTGPAVPAPPREPRSRSVLTPVTIALALVAAGLAAAAPLLGLPGVTGVWIPGPALAVVGVVVAAAAPVAMRQAAELQREWAGGRLYALLDEVERDLAARWALFEPGELGPAGLEHRRRVERGPGGAHRECRDDQQPEAQPGLAGRRRVGMAVVVLVEQPGDPTLVVAADRQEEVAVSDRLGEDERGVQHERGRRRVETDHGRDAGDRGVGEGLGHEHGPHREPGDQVASQPGPVVVPQHREPREHPDRGEGRAGLAVRHRITHRTSIHR